MGIFFDRKAKHMLVWHIIVVVPTTWNIIPSCDVMESKLVTNGFFRGKKKSSDLKVAHNWAIPQAGDLQTCHGTWKLLVRSCWNGLTWLHGIASLPHVWSSQSFCQGWRNPFSQIQYPRRNEIFKLSSFHAWPCVRFPVLGTQLMLRQCSGIDVTG